MAQEIILPEMGEGVIEGTLAKWLVKPGDVVEKYAPVAEVETDKVTTETTAETAGTILELCVSEGMTVPVGTVLAYIGEPGESVPDGSASDGTESSSAPEPAVASTEERPAVQTSPPAQRSGGYTGRVSPVVGRIASEHEIDLAQVPGTGRDGRITKRDVLAYLEQRADTTNGDMRSTTPTATPQTQPAPSAAVSQTAATSRPATVLAGENDQLLPLTTMRRSIAEHMVNSRRTSPHVTSVFEIDFSNVAAHRKANKEQFTRDGVNLTFTAYIVAATIQALKAHPLANSSWSDDGIILKRDINIGVAVAVEDGLIVPVIRNADGLNLLGLARAINDVTLRARNKQLKPADVQGGTFSITNHGTSGSLFAMPIINQPQSGILGVGKIEKRVKVINDAIAIRPMAYVSFTFDHRIMDGAGGDAFLSTIQNELEDWR